MYARGPGWAPGGAATGQEWDYIRELRFSSRFLNDVTQAAHIGIQGEYRSEF